VVSRLGSSMRRTAPDRRGLPAPGIRSRRHRCAGHVRRAYARIVAGTATRSMPSWSRWPATGGTVPTTPRHHTPRIYKLGASGHEIRRWPGWPTAGRSPASSLRPDADNAAMKVYWHRSDSRSTNDADRRLSLGRRNEPHGCPKRFVVAGGVSLARPVRLTGPLVMPRRRARGWRWPAASRCRGSRGCGTRGHVGARSGLR